MYNFLKSEKGNSLVFFTVMLSVIIGFAALTIDVGAIAFEKSKLASTIDSATLAGAQELVSKTGNASAVVHDYIQKNSKTLKKVDILTDTANKTIEVKGTKTVQNYFSKIWGNDYQDVIALAKARVENIESLKGARPLAVVQESFTYGKIYTLKEGAGDGLSGNYAAIALGGSGGSNYRDNLLNGYDGVLKIGDIIPTETGNISGITQTSILSLISQCNHSPLCTYQSYNVRCPRILFIPVVNTLDVNGRKSIKVLGFGTFFLEGVTYHGGQADVIGRFITYCMQGETSTEINDYGTYGIRLIK